MRIVVVVVTVTIMVFLYIAPGILLPYPR